MKTKFDFDILTNQYINKWGDAKIIGTKPNNTPYVSINIMERKYNGDVEHQIACIKDKDLERFAINILTALKSKRLKPAQKTKK